MTPQERLKEIEDFMDASGCLPNEDQRWLIARVHQLEEALRQIEEKNYSDFPLETLREELNVRSARTYDIARKALEENEG